MLGHDQLTRTTIPLPVVHALILGDNAPIESHFMIVKKTRRRRADGLATRQRILTASTKMFAASGYEATSLRQIAAASSIDIATLKYHYKGKPELFAQVYGEGHRSFVSAISPVMIELSQAQSAQDARVVVSALVDAIHDFVSTEKHFVKLTLFRLMEDSLDVIGLEDELQQETLEALEIVFADLSRRGITADVDARGFVVFLITSFCMWSVTAQVKPGWLGAPALGTKDGQVRSRTFFQTAIERMLGIEAS